MLRAILYCRCSSAETSRSGYSLPEQRALLTEYARLKGYAVLGLYEDGGESGRLVTRPQLEEIKRRAEAREFDLLIVKNFSRFFRKYWRAEELREWFRQRGVRVEYVEHASGETPSERLAEGVQGVVAEYQWEEVRAATMAARYTKARAGRVPSCCKAFGYHAVSKAESLALPEFHGRDGELLIVEAEAVIVRDLYRRAAAGESVSSLARALNAQGVRTRRGNPWSVTALRLLLQNPLYKGLFRYGHHTVRRVEGVLGRTGKHLLQRERRAAGWTEIPAPPLVDPALWEQVQERLAQTRGNCLGRPTHAYLLKGCVFCGTCRNQNGTPRACVGGRKSHDAARPRYEWRFYECGSKRDRLQPERGFCGARAHAPKLERLAVAALRRYAEPGYLAALARQQAQQAQRSAGDLPARRERVRVALAESDQEERRLADLILAGISPHIIAERLAAGKAKRAGLLAEQVRLDREAALLSDPEEAALRAEGRATTLRAALAAAGDDPDRLRPLLLANVRVFIRRGEAPRFEVQGG